MVAITKTRRKNDRTVDPEDDWVLLRLGPRLEEEEPEVGVLVVEVAGPALDVGRVAPSVVALMDSQETVQ